MLLLSNFTYLLGVLRRLSSYAFCYRLLQMFSRGSGPGKIATVFSSAKSLTSVMQFFMLTTFLLSGQSPDHLKPFTRWDVVLLSQRIFMSIGNNPFLNACIRVSRLKQQDFPPFDFNWEDAAKHG